MKHRKSLRKGSKIGTPRVFKDPRYGLNFDRDTHEARIGTPGYAQYDFVTHRYFESLLQEMARLAKKEGMPMQTVLQADRGTWMNTNAQNQGTGRAFAFVDVDGSWTEGPLYDASVLK